MAEPVRGAAGTWEWFGLWDGTQLDTAATLRSLPVDDLTASHLITAERPGEILHMPDARSGRWFIYDGTHHKPDRTSDISTMIGEYAARAQRFIDEVRRIVAARSDIAVQLATGNQATETQLEQARKKAWEPWSVAEKYHVGLRRSAGLNSLIGYLKGAPGVGVAEEDLEDRWPEYLNCRNGVVCLRSGQMYPHSPAWRVTYCLDVDYVPGARGQGWERLAWHVAGESVAVAQYMIRMLGYSLLGDNREQLVFFLTGPTGSGKSQLMEAVAEVLGTLAHASSGALISRNKTERHARVENSLAGKRFVFIDESAERIHIDEGQLKRLTGSGMISRNKLYADTEIPTRVTWTPWQPTNELPTLPGFDDAIRRRLRCIPCGDTIPKQQRIKGLGKMLAKTEGEAILATLVSGCMEYLRDGMEQCPVEIELATAQYEADQDTAARFRDECTVDVPWVWGAAGQQNHAVRKADLYREYVAWGRKTRVSTLGIVAFNKAFGRLPGIQNDENQKRWVGIMVTSNHRNDYQDAGS